MHIEGPSSGFRQGPFERLVSRMYMTSNEWTLDEGGGASLGTNLKGMLVCLDLKPASYSNPAIPMGQGCCIPKVVTNSASYMAPLGILLSDMIIGSKKLVDVYVDILRVGHCDRIITRSATSVQTTDHLLYCDGLASGEIAGMTTQEYTASYRTMTGGLLIDTAGVGPAVVDLSGVNSVQTTWVLAPKVVNLPVGGAPGRDYQKFIGYHYEGDVPIHIVEFTQGTSPDATLYQVQGFIDCLGGVHSW